MTRLATPLTEDQLLAYFEGSLPVADARSIAAQLGDDVAAKGVLAAWSAQNDTLATLYPVGGATPIPARLTDVLRHARAATPSSQPWLRIAASAVILAVGLAAGWLARDLTAPATPAGSLSQTALSAHQTYVIETRHAVEVPASDAEHMNKWMSKRLGRDMQPPDLAASGFTLLGGRILPAAEGSAGLYMYEDAAGQRITLYILPQRVEGAAAEQLATDGPTQSINWVGQDVSCVVVGDIPRAALQRLAQSVWDQLI